MGTIGALRRQRRDQQQGAAAVELALVLPILFLLLFGIIVYGIVFAQHLSLSNAARQMARSGVIEGATCAQLTAQLTSQKVADTIAMQSSDVTYTITRGTSKASSTNACTGGGQLCAGQTDGTNIYVVLDYQTSKSGISFPFVPVPSTLEETGAFRCEL